MYFVKNSVLTMVFTILLVVPLVSAVEVNFTGGETKYFNVSIPYSSLTHFNFTITGDLNLGSYPSNITVSIANHDTSDWQYQVYPTTQPARADSVANAWSDNPSSNTIDFLNLSEGFYGEMFYFGNLVNNVFGENGGNSLSEQGYLGIGSADSTTLNPQIVTIASYNSTIHAFIPSITLEFASTAFYVTKGGSTYYCNTEHSLPFDPLCDLSVTNAINPAHLAREVDKLYFDYTEPVSNPYTLDKINTKLQSCGNPCNIEFKVKSASAGKIIIEDFDFNGTSAPEALPANISLSENANSYSISIQNTTPVNEVKYFYGSTPKIYLVAFQAEDELRTLNVNQTTRLNNIQNDLALEWDELTNYSFPLEFVFYNLTDPYDVEGLHTSTNYNDFSLFVSNNSFVNYDDSSILVLIDVWDYYPNVQPHNSIGQGSALGLFAMIYVNGIFNKSITTLENYDDEIIKNVLLHEIAHSFIGYPQSTINNQDLFYAGHPAGFRDDNIFEDTYDLALSPTGNEGYFDFYSIMNPVRAYMTASEVGRDVELSDFDKMIMGLTSSEYEKNYTFYEGSVVLSGNNFVMSSMTPGLKISTSDIYPYNSRSWVYDILTNNTGISVGTQTSFSVPKQDQNGKALWVFANDNSNPEHFKVFNNNAESNVLVEQKIIAGDTTSVNRTLPANYTSGVALNVNITLTFDPNDCAGAYVETLPSGWNVTDLEGSGAPFYNSALNTINWAPIDGPICGGNTMEYLSYTVVPNSTQTGSKVILGQFSVDGVSIYLNSTINQNITIDNIVPSISNLVANPASPVTYSTSTIYRFNATITDVNIDKVIVEFNGTNYTTNRNGNVYSFSISNLKAGSYNYRWIANDTFRNQNVSSTQSFVVNKANAITSIIFDKTSPQNYTNTVNASCRVLAGTGSAVLYRNGIDVTLSENSKSVTLGVGTYNYNCTIASSQNYSAGQNTSIFIINKSNGNLTLLINGIGNNLSILEGISVNASVNSLYSGTTLYRNGVNVTNESGRFILLSAGYYNYTAVNPGNQNYSSVVKSYFVNVTSVPQGVLVFDIDLSKWNLNTTTNFTRYNRTELGNLSNVTFDNAFGKIRYLSTLNLNQSRSLIGLIEIVNLKLWINSSNIPEFNRAAEITFYNVSLATPLIKVDGNDCSASICTDISYNTINKTFTFKVTGFSTYELVEMPITPPDNGGNNGGGGGGGGGGSTKPATLVNNTNITKVSNISSVKSDTSTNVNNNVNSNNENNVTNLTVNTPITGSAINSSGNSTGKLIAILGVVFIIVLAIVLNLVKIYKKKKLEEYVSKTYFF